MNIVVVWNGRAGSAADVDPEGARARLAAAFDGADVRIDDVTDGGDPAAAARRAVAAGAGVVIAAGGDGTVSAVAAELVGVRCCLGVIPLGTSNSFAAALGIPATVDDALALIAGKCQRKLDVAVVRGAAGTRTMVLHCMIGFHAETIAETSSGAKRRWGVLAYAASAAKQLAQLETFAVELATDAQVVRCRASAIAVANLAPLKTVLAHGPSHLLGDDGMVDVTLVAADTIGEALATGVHLWRSAREGEPAERDNVGSLSCVAVEVATEPPQQVLVDGEPFGLTPITVETIPRALTVYAPEAPEASGPPVEASLIGLPELEISRA